LSAQERVGPAVEAQEAMDRHAQGLRADNDRLRARVEEMQREREALLAGCRLADEALGDNAVLRAENRALDAKQRMLEEKAAQLQERIERDAARHAELEARIQAFEEESRRVAREYLAVAQQNSSLANLYVAGYRLHAGLTREEVVEAVREIIATLVGSEEMALFERHDHAPVLSLVDSVGIDADAFRTVALGTGVIGRTAEKGQTYLAEAGAPEQETRAPGEEKLTACIPLTLAGRVTGLIAVFGLLSHKPALEPVDLEIFDLLARQASMALYCTRLGASPPATSRRGA